MFALIANNNKSLLCFFVLRISYKVVLEFMKVFMRWFTLVSLLFAGFSQSWAGTSTPLFQQKTKPAQIQMLEKKECHHYQQKQQKTSGLHDCCKKHGNSQDEVLVKLCPHSAGQCGCEGNCHGSAQLAPISDYMHASVFNAVSAVFVQETPFPYITFVQIERPPKFI